MHREGPLLPASALFQNELDLAASWASVSEIGVATDAQQTSIPIGRVEVTHGSDTVGLVEAMVGNADLPVSEERVAHEHAPVLDECRRRGVRPFEDEDFDELVEQVAPNQVETDTVERGHACVYGVCVVGVKPLLDLSNRLELLLSGRFAGYGPELHAQVEVEVAMHQPISLWAGFHVLGDEREHGSVVRPSG